MKLQPKLRLIIISFLTIFISCMYLPPDKKNVLRGDDVIARLKGEAKAIDNFYFTTNVKNFLPYKSSHNYGLGLADFLETHLIKINPHKNYEKEGVNECVNNMRSLVIGLPLGGIPTLLTCDIREAGFIELGFARSGGKSTRKNQLLLNLLLLP